MFLSSLYFALLAKLKIWQTTETYTPQTFSITAPVVAPAVVICLNYLIAILRFRKQKFLTPVWGRSVINDILNEKYIRQSL